MSSTKNTDDEISQPYPGIWIRKSQQDVMNEWFKEREKQFQKWVMTGKMEPQTDINASNETNEVK